MSILTVDADIAGARDELSVYVRELPESEARGFWEAFGAAAAAYRRARAEGPAAREFAGIVQELRRDARGTILTIERERERAAVEYPPVPAREPWATMPTDGSERLTLPEKIVYSLIGAACVVALLVMGWTFGVIGGSDADAPAPADTRTPSQVVSDADLITQGGYWTWEVTETCGMRPAAECHATLREVNDAARHYGLKVFEDGSIAPADQY